MTGGDRTDLLHELALRQFADLRARTPGTFFADPGRPELTVEDAYAVQAELAALRGPAEQVIGYKVGCTGPGTRAQFGLDGPVRGMLFDTELHESGAELSHGAYANLAIEGELAVRIGEEGRIAQVLPVVELHHYVFRGQPPTLPELIANNALNAGVVLPAGPGTAWHGDEPLTGRLEVRINGVLVDEGPMDGVPGGPAGSVAWLARQLAASGRSLQPGQLVLTGTPLGLLPVRPGDSVRVTAGDLGAVEATIDA